jgi:hypothetical protein
MHVCIVQIPWAKTHVAAIIEGLRGGQAAGTALAEVILGTVNPSGRMPYTVVPSVAQLPPYDDMDITAGRSYRYCATRVQSAVCLFAAVRRRITEIYQLVHTYIFEYIMYHECVYVSCRRHHEQDTGRAAAVVVRYIHISRSLATCNACFWPLTCIMMYAMASVLCSFGMQGMASVTRPGTTLR